MSKLRCYCASQMTGRTGIDLVNQSAEVARLAEKYNIEALDPIQKENVKAVDKPLHNHGKTLREYWKKDKEMIQNAHVLIDLTGPRKSEGTAHEIGLARYFLYKPVVRVYENLGPSIARFEDDIIVGSMDEAFNIAVYHWGTPKKRLQWRWLLYKRCLPGMIKAFFREWRNCIW